MLEMLEQLAASTSWLLAEFGLTKDNESKWRVCFISGKLGHPEMFARNAENTPRTQKVISSLTG